jgi:hypothetical protein
MRLMIYHPGDWISRLIDLIFDKLNTGYRKFQWTSYVAQYCTVQTSSLCFEGIRYQSPYGVVIIASFPPFNYFKSNTQNLGMKPREAISLVHFCWKVSKMY